MKKFFFAFFVSGIVSYSYATVDDGFKALGAKDYSAAFSEFYAAAQDGNAEGQFELGTMYEEGKGTEQNTNLAIIWYRKAVAQQHTGAMVNLGNDYVLGRGVEKNTAEAIRLYRLAADGGSAVGAMKLGLAYKNGVGAPHDANQAKQWFQISANKGNGIAATNLGVMFEDGEGGPKNLSDAAKWYRVGLQYGDNNAARFLGMLYMDGDGVQKDSVIAYALLSQWPDQSPSLKSMLTLLEGEMSPSQVRRAHELSTRMEQNGKIYEVLKKVDDIATTK